MPTCSMLGCGMWRTTCLLAVLGTAAVNSAAQNGYVYSPPIDPFYMQVPPVFPQSNADCQAYQSSYSSRVSQLSAEHQACLTALASESRPVSPTDMAVCSVAACQYIHDQWQAALHAQDQISTMVSDCTNVVSENAARLAAAQAQSTSNAAAPPIIVAVSGRPVACQHRFWCSSQRGRVAGRPESLATRSR